MIVNSIRDIATPEELVNKIKDYQDPEKRAQLIIKYEHLQNKLEDYLDAFSGEFASKMSRHEAIVILSTILYIEDLIMEKSKDEKRT